jgi:hypothetical protein
MRLIDLNRNNANKGSRQKFPDRFSQFKSGDKPDEHAEEAIIARLTRALDNRFVLLRNLPFEGTAARFPPILIGPLGILLLNLSPVSGVFRAKEDMWWEMSKTSPQFNSAHPNLIKQSQEYAQKLAILLEKRGKSHPEIVPVLVFTNPGVHIESGNPAIRIVLMDGMDNLISNILNSDEVLTATEISNLADSLELMVDPDKAIPMGEGEDFFGRDLLEPKKNPGFSLPKFTLPATLSLPAMEEKLQFSPKQWFILEVLMVLVILVLIGGIVYILLIY